MKTNMTHTMILRNEANDAPEGGGTATLPEPAKLRHAIALMPAATLKIVAAANPKLKAALAGHSVNCRGLGDTHEKLKKLDNDEIGPDTLVIGFNVPINLVYRARKSIEIPLGNSVKKARVAGYPPENTAEEEALVKALAEAARIPLRAWTAQQVPVIDPVEGKEADEEEEETVTF